MALDASIYGQLDTQAPLRLSQMLMQNADPLAQAQKVMALKAMIGQGQMQDMQMRSAQADAEETTNLRRLLADPSFNRAAPDASAKVMAVAPVKGAAILDAWQKGDVAQSTIAENRAKAADLEQKNKLALLDHMSNVAGTMKDQKSYERGAMYLASLSPTLYQQVQQWPAQHDPGFVSQLAQQSISAKDQVAQALQQRNVESEIANRLATQQTARGNLDVAKGNLGVSMQRLNMEADNARNGITYQTDGNGNLVALPSRVQPGSDIVGRSVVGNNGQPLSGGVKPLTEFQGKALTYATRMANADKILTELEGKISTSGLSAKQGMENVPVVGGLLGAAANSLLSKDQQLVDQAQRDFINAVLRQESGAAISQSEFESYRKQYFPEVGDTPEKIAQKRENRRIAIEGMKTSGGPQASSIDVRKRPMSDGDSTPPGAQSRNRIPDRATMQQITETARKYGKTVDEVIRDARAKGIEVR